LQDRADGDLGVGLDEVPARQRRHPEDVLLGVVVAGLELLRDQVLAVVAQVVVVRWIAKGRLQLRPALLEGVRDVLEEDETEDDVLVDRCIEHGQQLVGCGPELLVQVVEELLFVGVHPTSFRSGGRRWGARNQSIGIAES